MNANSATLEPSNEADFGEIFVHRSTRWRGRSVQLNGAESTPQCCNANTFIALSYSACFSGFAFLLLGNFHRFYNDIEFKDGELSESEMENDRLFTKEIMIAGTILIGLAACCFLIAKGCGIIKKRIDSSEET